MDRGDASSCGNAGLARSDDCGRVPWGAGVQVFAPLQNAVPGEVMLLTFEWRLRFCELECTLVGQSDGSIHPLVHLQWADLSWKSVRQLQLMANYLRDAA